MSAESVHDEPATFTVDDLKHLGFLSEKVKAAAEWYGSRLVVAVYERDDMGPVAWIECHPSDSHASVSFVPPSTFGEAT